MQQQKGKGPPAALIAGVVAAAVLLVLLLLGVCAWRRWRWGRQTAQSPDDGGSSRQAEAGIRIPRIHADKPQQAAEAMRALNAPAAIVSTTWRPER
jgi:cytochrome c-type biogenesis protein CcmH/NrfG